jgi:hypothetical protein
MTVETVKGFAIARGKIVQREIFVKRKDAATRLDLKTAKGKRGWAVRYGRVIETLTTPSLSKRRGSGKLRHQEIGGQGQCWDDWSEPLPTRVQAQRKLVKHLSCRVTSAKASLRSAERELAKALAK